MTTTSTELVPFGKHKGKPMDALLDDRPYLDWLTTQAWFGERYPKIYQVVINYGAEPSETPEHNRLQAKFSDPAYCMALVAAGFSRGGHINTVADLQLGAGQYAGEYADRLRFGSPLVTDFQIERENWDVTFGYRGAAAEFVYSPLPDCTCAPDVSLSSHVINANRDIYPMFLDKRYGTPKLVTSNNDGYGPDRMRPSHQEYLEATRHESGCVRASTEFFRIWGAKEWGVGEGGMSGFGIECKPMMGDDYPAVIRQINALRRRQPHNFRIDGQAWMESSWRFLVAAVIGNFQSTAVTLDQVRALFATNDIRLVMESDLDTKVAAHRDEWFPDAHAESVSSVSLPTYDF